MASQPPPSRSQQQTRTDQRTEQRTEHAPPPQQTQTKTTPDVQTEVIPVVQTKAGQAPGIKAEEAKVTAGAGGERNIVITMVPVPLPTCMTAYFQVKTATGNPLEVTLQQLEYRKTESGMGSVKTHLIPEAPIGTKGKAIARDLMTGEIQEHPWTWHLVGGGGEGGGLGLWGMIKKLLGISGS